jgi:hypothetical protein
MFKEVFVVPQLVKKPSTFCIVSAVDLRENVQRNCCCIACVVDS